MRNLVLPAVVLALVAAACTGSSSSSPPPTPSAEESLDVGPIPQKPTDYVLAMSGVSAEFKPDDEGGTLSVTNESGEEIAAPGLYVLDARSGRRISGTVEDSTSIADGKGASFSVTFPAAFDPDNIGLVALLVGNADYGAFLPQ